MGPCPRSHLWRDAIPEKLALPWLMPANRPVPLVWRCAEVHLSHRLQYRGCLFCRTCGARSAKAVSPALVAPCILRPSSVTTKRRLTHMKLGRCPDSTRGWPLEPDAQAPGYLVPLLGSAATGATTLPSPPPLFFSPSPLPPNFLKGVPAQCCGPPHFSGL